MSDTSGSRASLAVPPVMLDGAFAPGVTAVRSATSQALSLQKLPSGWGVVQDGTMPEACEITAQEGGPWFAVRRGGWSGAVKRVAVDRIEGWASDDLHAERILNVLALDSAGCVVAHGHTLSGSEGPNSFQILLPQQIVASPRSRRLNIMISGSDYVLEGGRLTVGANLPIGSPPKLTRRSQSEPVIAIKISTPNLKEAPLWGDYHFARSLAASFSRIGLSARIETQDSWDSASNYCDVNLVIRGRHRAKLDTGKINLMWMISHPDRIPDTEFGDFDHVAVASDLYAKRLREVGLCDALVMHQATDAAVFGGVASVPERLKACLFVGNSRRAYRTMVKWCVQRRIPLELYGGGWDGILPPEAVRAQSVANTDLPACYARHLLLLNDHWDSMRSNGFLSNRLFDGSATGTPILSDPVAGLADVFGDTISQAGDAEEFADKIRDCLENPSRWLARAARARDIVLGHHTFDHRALQIAKLIGLSALKNVEVALAARSAALSTDARLLI